MSSSQVLWRPPSPQRSPQALEICLRLANSPLGWRWQATGWLNKRLQNYGFIDRRWGVAWSNVKCVSFKGKSIRKTKRVQTEQSLNTVPSYLNEVSCVVTCPRESAALIIWIGRATREMCFKVQLSDQRCLENWLVLLLLLLRGRGVH